MQVERIGRTVDPLTRRYLAGPGHKHRRAKTLVRGRILGRQAKGIAVVDVEQEQRVFVFTGGLEFIDQLGDPVIEPCSHRVELAHRGQVFCSIALVERGNRNIRVGKSIKVLRGWIVRRMRQ